MEIVCFGWLNYPTLDIISKLNYCIADMDRWSKNDTPQFQKLVAQYQKDLENVRLNDDDDAGQVINDINGKLSCILLQEDSYWRQRAKNFWLRDGDTNTKFFYASATARKKKNKINRLKSDADVWVDYQQGLCNLVFDYFSNIYQARQGNFTPVTSCLSRCISDEDNGSLTASFTEDEFCRAVFDMHPDKSPGPNGLNPAFYHRFWPILGKEVFEAYCNWLSNGRFPPFS